MATVVFFSIHDLEKYSDLRNFSCHVTDMFKFDDIVILANKTSKMLKKQNRKNNQQPCVDVTIFPLSGRQLKSTVGCQ